METNLNRVAEDLFDKIEGFPNIVLKDQNNQPIPPSMEDQIGNARIFNFNFITDGVNLGPVTVTISDNDGLQIKTYNDPVEGKPEKIQDSWYAFIASLSEFATEHVIKFKGPKIVTQKITAKSEVGESKMTESKLVGTSKTSYQDLGEATLIVKHSKPINYNAANGRTQHIERIYIENAMGERFCYPFKHLNGARAMATHIIAGGTPYDDIGQHVIGLSEELNKLRMFKGYVTRSPMVAEAMGAVTDKVFNRIEGIKKELHHLQSKNYYAEWSEGFSKTEARIIPEDMAAEWIDRLTIKTFNEDLKTVFPYLLNIIEESDLPTVELDAEALLNSFAQVQELAEPARDIQELVDLENFVDTLIKEDIDDGIFSTDPEQRTAAIEKLNELIRENPEATLGLGGENGKRMLADIMKDDALMAEIDDRAEQNQCSADSLWDVVREYLQFKSPEMLKDNGGEIDFNPEPATAPAVEPAEPVAAPAPAAEPAPAVAPAEPVPQQEGWQSGLEQRLGKIKSLAEQSGRDFDSINLNINGKSYSLSEALSAFNLLESDESDNGWYVVYDGQEDRRKPYQGPFNSPDEAQAWINTEGDERRGFYPEDYSVYEYPVDRIGQIEDGEPVEKITPDPKYDHEPPAQESDPIPDDSEDDPIPDDQGDDQDTIARLQELSGMNNSQQGVTEGMEDSPVASAITRRILMQRADLLSKYGPEKVTAAIDEVADFVGDVEEIGSSDVSGWIKQVEQSLAGMAEEVAVTTGNPPLEETVSLQGQYGHSGKLQKFDDVEEDVLHRLRQLSGMIRS